MSSNLITWKSDAQFSIEFHIKMEVKCHPELDPDPLGTLFCIRDRYAHKSELPMCYLMCQIRDISAKYHHVDHTVLPGEKSLEFDRIRKFVEFGRILSNSIEFEKKL